MPQIRLGQPGRHETAQHAALIEHRALMVRPALARDDEHDTRAVALGAAHKSPQPGMGLVLPQAVKIDAGIDLAAAVERRWPALPVVLTSGYSDVLARTGASGFPLLQKPYSAENLARALRHALATSGRVGSGI